MPYTLKPFQPEPIVIPMEDPIIHVAEHGYYCSSLENPDWATCPCRVAAEEQMREWQAEQDYEDVINHAPWLW